MFLWANVIVTDDVLQIPTQYVMLLREAFWVYSSHIEALALCRLAALVTLHLIKHNWL